MSILNVAKAVAAFWCSISNGLSGESSYARNGHACKADTQTGGLGMVQKKSSLESITLKESARDAALMGDGMENARAESLRTSLMMQNIAEELPEGDTKSLLRTFRICSSCNRFVRVGESNDGGYLICPEHFKEQPLLGAYSMGIANHDKLSHDINNLTNAPVFQFDCTVDGPAQNCKDCHFYKVCLEGEADRERPQGMEGKTFWTLPEVMANTSKADVPDRSLFLKIDIEGPEWPIFAESHSSWLKKFNQIVCEFHGLQKEEKHKQYLQAMQALLGAGFQVAHLHGNNCGEVYKKGKYFITSVIEVTFVSKGGTLDNCLESEPINPLDAPNLPENPEVSSGVFPEAAS